MTTPAPPPHPDDIAESHRTTVPPPDLESTSASTSDPEPTVTTADAHADDECACPEFIWWILLGLEILRWLEQRLVDDMYRAGIWTLRWGMAFIFLWFGAIKLFIPPPVTMMFADAFPFLPPWFPAALGVWEMLIGVCFLRRSWMRWGIYQMKFHMPGTFLPLLVIPGGAFAVVPVIPALPGLYILKNIIFIGGTLILWHDLLKEDEPRTPPDQSVL